MGDSGRPAPGHDDRTGGNDAALEKLSRRITLLGSIIAAFVAMNSALTTCTNDTAARYAGFRQAVAAEEAFWKELYSDYLGVFGANVAPEEKTAKLFAISALADRHVPDFTEYRLGLLDNREAKQLAKQRFTTMQLRLKQALDRAESSDPKLIAARQAQQFASAEATALKPPPGSEAAQLRSEVTTVSPTESVGLTFETLTLSRGRANAWDVDVFWCAGGGTEVETVNFALARDRARLLAAAADKGELLAPGVRLGRIRVRVLPESRQGVNPRTQVAHPRLGDPNQLRSEPRERAASDPVLNLINQGQAKFIYFSSGTRTPWYFSLFSCGASPMAAAPAPPQPQRAAS